MKECTNAGLRFLLLTEVVNFRMSEGPILHSNILVSKLQMGIFSVTSRYCQSANAYMSANIMETILFMATSPITINYDASEKGG